MEKRLKVVDALGCHNAVWKEIIYSYGTKNGTASKVRSTKLKRVSQVPGVTPRRARRRRTGRREEGGEVGWAETKHGTVNNAKHRNVSPAGQRGQREMK